MAFDIRNFDYPSAPPKQEFWTVNYLRHVDDFFTKINSECECLFNGINPTTEAAFKNKIKAWKSFIEATQRLCQLYKVKDAKCLSKKN